MHTTPNLNFPFKAFIARLKRKSPKVIVSRHSHTFDRYNRFLPNPDHRLSFKDDQGIDVGYVSYAISPLYDRVYIHMINIHENMRRKGFGTAILLFLKQIYRLEICPIQPVSGAYKFWQHAESIKLMDLNQAIGSTGIDREAEKWAHLHFDKKAHVNEIESREISDWYLHEFGRAPEIAAKYPTNAVYEALLTRHLLAQKS